MMGMLRRTPIASSQRLPPAIAASATTLSRLIAASASMMTAAADMKSLASAGCPDPSAALSWQRTLRAMTISIQAPTSFTSGMPRSALANKIITSLSAIAPPAPRMTARRALSGGRRPQAIAMTIALSAPSSRSTKKICSSRKSEAPMSLIAGRPPARGRPIRPSRWASRFRALIRRRSRLQEPHEIRIGSDDHGRAGIGERALVGLERANHRVKLWVPGKGVRKRPVGLGVALAARDGRTALGLGENDRAVAIRLGLDLLGPFVALGPQFLGFTLSLGLHAVVDRLTGLERQVGASEAHFVDRDAESGGFGRDFRLDRVEDAPALVGQQGPQRRLTERAPRSGADEQAQLCVGRFRGPHGLIEAQRIDDPVTGVGLDLEPLLVAHDRLLDLGLEQQRARRGHIDRVDERDLEFQTRLFDDRDGGAEADDQRLLAFADDVDRREGEIERQRARSDDGEPAASHLTAPGVGAAGVADELGAGMEGVLNSVTGR